MNFKKIKSSNIKRNIIIVIFIISVISAMVLNFTRAKYKVTESIPLVNGTINYSLADLNIVAIYQENENGEYESINEVPTSGYALNEEESYCEINNIKQDNIIINYNTSTKSLSISPMTTKGTKCYLYFDKSILFYNQLLADNPTRLTRTDFSAPLETENTGTLYTVGSPWIEEFEGSLDTVYYFAGNALNNWVKFGQDSTGADLYWRIIRTNEDGSIRLLYSGTSPDTTEGYISISEFNNNSADSMYLGYMYGTTGSIQNNRLNTNDSTIKEVIDNWYSSGLNIKTDLSNILYDSYISETATYCNERASNASRNRLENYKPSHKCGSDIYGILLNDSSNSDKFSLSKSNGGNGQLSYPIALITVDEVIFAGGKQFAESKAYFYYNSNNNSIVGEYNWWTMSARSFIYGESTVYPVGGSYFPGSINGMSGTSGTTIGNLAVRPVISLKSCVNWSNGNGSPDNPYEVSIDSNCASVEN